MEGRKELNLKCKVKRNKNNTVTVILYWCAATTAPVPVATTVVCCLLNDGIFLTLTQFSVDSALASNRACSCSPSLPGFVNSAAS